MLVPASVRLLLTPTIKNALCMSTNKAKRTQDYYPHGKIYRSPKFRNCSLLSFTAVISAGTMRTLRFPSLWQLLVCQECIVLM